jgi:hypothetical protein
MNKVLRLLTLTLAMALTALGASAASSGDVNSDGVLSVADAVILARFVAEDEKLTAKQIAAISGSDSADLDSDGIVTMLDVNALLRKLATASAD